MIKKAILTGGGRATRLRPITNTINKHLIPLANKPMIFHAIEKVARAGVTEIFINTNPGETELQKIIGNGDRFGVKISFFEQVGGPQGIAHVVKLAQKFIGDDPFMFYLSDNIILAELNKLVDKFTTGNFDCLLALSQVKDPERFGVPIFNAKGELIEVQEKPTNPPNNFAVTGIYLYGPKLFFEAFDHIAKSARGEYEISDIHSYFLKTGRKVGHEEITGWWKDTGKVEDLILANKLLMDLCGIKFEIGQNVKRIGSVKIVEPVCVGDDCVLENCAIGPYTAIGKNSVIKNTRLSNAIVFEECIVESPVEIDQIVISRDSTMSAKIV
ncbi:MAG: sugar phosphate nucleotidyltransferase [Candidatus Magasanikbacteria bacterium]